MSISLARFAPAALPRSVQTSPSAGKRFEKGVPRYVYLQVIMESDVSYQITVTAKYKTQHKDQLSIRLAIQLIEQDLIILNKT